MKNKILCFCCLFFLLISSGCQQAGGSDDLLTPELKLASETLTLHVGDKFEPFGGVSATGTAAEDVLNLVEYWHEMPLDVNQCVTQAGTYEVEYYLTINKKTYTAKLTVYVLLNQTEELTNGDLELGTIAPFVKSDFEGSDSTLSVININNNRLLELDIDAVSWASAAPRIEYSGLVLNANQAYQISFDAYASEARAMHIQIGELMDESPWYKAAYASTHFFDLTTNLQTFTWQFKPSADVAGANLENLSLLFEFGKYENRPSGNVEVYLDNFKIELIDVVKADETVPVLLSTAERDYFFLNEYLRALNNITCLDENGEILTPAIDEENSTMPPLDEEGRFTTAGNYAIVFYAIDAAGNKGTYTWNIEVQNSYPVVNGFNIIDFLDSDEGSISEGVTQYGYVYAANSDTTFTYEDGILTINTTQSQTEDDWTATQVFARTVRQTGFSGEGAKWFTFSFDITSNVEGYIQVNQLPFKIIKGTTTIAIEDWIFNYNYEDIAIVLGVHKSLMSVEQNIGPCEVSISNLSYVNTHTSPDVIPPVIKLNGNVTYFVGDEFDVYSTVVMSDVRGSKGATLVVDEENSDEIPLVDGKLTEAGVYHVTFLGTDAYNNQSSYEFIYTVRGQLVNSDGFSVERIQFGEEGTIDDPSTVYLWNDNGVNVTSEVIDYNNFKFTTDQTNSAPWYATQLFFKSLDVDKWTLYELSFDIISDVAGHITVMNEGMEIAAGTTTITKQIAIPKDGFQKITMQIGRSGYGNMGSCAIEIRNLSLVEADIPEVNQWEGYGMEVVNNDTSSVVTYADTPSAWSSHNARTYIFDATATFQAMRIDFIGTANQRYQFKFEGTTATAYSSTSITATGELQSVILDFRNSTQAQRLSMYNLLVFVETVGASGTVTIMGYTFYEDFGDAFDTEWFSLGGMTVVDENDTSIISYSNISSSWWNANAQYTMTSQFSETTKSVTFTFTGTADQTYLFKVEGGGYSKELAIKATGVEQTLELDVTSIGTNRSKLNLAVVFCQTVGATGVITISNVVVNPVE